MPLSALPNAPTNLSSCRICIILLDKEELQISVESKNVKIGYLFSKVCEHLAIKETKYFGLAQERDGEFRFLKMQTKLQKFASKLWKSKHILADQPILTFYLRVQYYVDNIGLLREPVTRLQYYLQLRDNLLHYGRISNEEKCFVLAAYALQADFGPYNADVHVGTYFDPCRYFPAWVIMRRGQEYITSNLPAMHRDLTSMNRTDAQNAFIRELLSSPVCHNFHLYRLHRDKYNNVSTIWIAVCPRGLEILEEMNDFKNQIAVFLWQSIEKLHCDKKKFEIVTDALAERKFSYYTTSKEWGEHLLNLCRSTHHFQIALQPRVIEMKHQEVQDQHFREMYVHDGNVRSSYGNQRQTTVLGSSTGQTENPASDSFVALLSTKVTDCHLGSVQDDQITKTPSNEGSDHREIMIVSPPLMSSTLTTISPMSEQSTSLLWLYTNEKLNSKHPSGISSSFRQTSATTEIGLHGRGGLSDKHSVSSFAKSNSSEESLITGSLSSSNSLRYGQLQQSFTSSPALKQHRDKTKNDMKAAPSVYSMSSWLSTSPNSSTSSSQLAFSIPAKSTIVDAASLRKSLPHGTTLNEYISQIMSGENTELLESKYQKQRCRKSSLDQPKLCFTYADSNKLPRSASFGQAKKLSIHKQGTSQASETSFLREKGNENYCKEYQVLAQQLLQVPIAAQAQKTVIPKKMTAISAAVRPVASCAPGGQVDAGGDYFATLFSPEKPVSKFPPLHSTPMISRYQMQEIHTADVPVLNFTTVNSVNLCFMPSPVVPSPSFSVPSSVTASEFDYRCQYFPQILGCNQNTNPKPPAFGDVVMHGNGPKHDTVLEPSSSWTVQMCSRPPPYSEWQAAKALASLNAERINLESRSSEQTDKTEVNGERHRLPNGFVDGKPNREVYLSISSATDGVNTPMSSVHEALAQTSVPTMLHLPYSFQEHADQHNSLMPRSVEAVGDVCHYNADSDEMSSSVSVKNLNGQQKYLVSGGPVICKGADMQMNVREKLQNLRANLPLLSALLKDKSLLTYHNKPDRSRDFRLVDAAAGGDVS